MIGVVSCVMRSISSCSLLGFQSTIRLLTEKTNEDGKSQQERHPNRCEETGEEEA